VRPLALRDGRVALCAPPPGVYVTPAMRLKSEIWVKAYIRRCQHEGVVAVLGRRGDADAGAIYIKVSRLDGSALLFGPAPSGLDEAREERRWEPSLGGLPVAETEADAYLQRQVAFDSDIWIVAVEDGAGRHFLEDWLIPK
jgi:hypothetical protein